ncbi:MAG: hypothetical protein EWV80_09895 [Microcystis aeruginosa Ma_QC_B_20070730_S2]|uniref:Uncharacterized protein n=1 Tax=Microcystis aeruginosa Ma_QC_B_20070730_S2 TaxID=2486256 RepID=A0A552DSS6_MICAE|nr:MAG: hypothetical protein EWV80_09895 [Microcystis aeruginosa Ma_QC_B_20070730_S2]
MILNPVIKNWLFIPPFAFCRSAVLIYSLYSTDLVLFRHPRGIGGGQEISLLGVYQNVRRQIRADRENSGIERSRYSIPS